MCPFGTAWYPYLRRLPRAGIGLLLVASAGAAPGAKSPPPPQPAAPAPGPHVVGDRFYPAPNAQPFSRGSAPGVWVRDVPPDARPGAARAVPAPPGGTGTGFYSPRMTYLMPGGRCVSGPPLPAKPAHAKTVKASAPAVKAETPARATVKGARR